MEMVLLAMTRMNSGICLAGVDLVWRAYKGSGRPDPGVEEAYLAIGLSRGFTAPQGRHVPPSPMVVAVLTFPPRAARPDSLAS